MSILDRIARPKPRGSIPKHTTFRLTESGRDKLADYAGDPQSRILIALEVSHASVNVEEIARACRFGVGQVERLIPNLVRAGYVQPATAGEADVW